MFDNLGALATKGLNFLTGAAGTYLGERDKARDYELEKKRLDIQAFQAQRETEQKAAEAATGSQLTNIMRFAGFGLLGLVIVWVGVMLAKRILR